MKFPASYKTLVAGFVGGGILVIGELCDLFQIGIPNLTNGLFEVQVLLAGLATMKLGWNARDDDVSSEEAKAKP